MYTQKPFTNVDAERALLDLTGKFDDKRTLCNVIRFIFESIQDDSYNLNAARSLCLEAMWMSKRMHAKLEDTAKLMVDKENIDNDGVIEHAGELYYPVEGDDENMFSVDWSQYSNLPAKGNWD